MFSFVTILLSAALFAAIIFILAGNFRFSKKATGIFMFLAVALGVPLYGAGYAYLSPDNLPLAVLRTCFSVCGMFLGRSDALLVADTPVYENPILAAGLWFACTCALCATASAAITTVGAKAMKRIRVLMARRGELSIIYGVNEDSVSLGQQIMERRGNSVVFVDKSVSSSLMNTISSTRAVLRTDASALSCDGAFLKSVGVRPGPRKISVYAVDWNPANNISFAGLCMKGMEQAQLKPEQTALILNGSESSVGSKFQALGEKYGFGSVTVFNDASVAARMLIRSYPPYKTLRFREDGSAAEDFDALIIGFGRVGQAVLAELVKNGQFQGSTFHAAVFSRDMDSISGYYHTGYETLLANYDIELRAADARSRQMYDYLRAHAHTLKYAVICCGSEKVNEEIEEDLSRHLRAIHCSAQVYQCTYSGLRHSDPATLDTEMKDIYRLNLIRDSRLDAMAMELNHMYCSNPDSTASEDWARCDYFSRMSSRASADFMPAMLYAVGKTEQEVVENGLNLTPEQRQVLGMTEHLRWCAFHYVMGYRPMPPETFEERAAEYLRQKQETGTSQVRITKNAAEREHACLIPWDELDELSRRENEITGKNLDYKEMDIQNVLAIEKLLRKCRGNGWS